jgi:hypothetical protein
VPRLPGRSTNAPVTVYVVLRSSLVSSRLVVGRRTSGERRRRVTVLLHSPAVGVPGGAETSLRRDHLTGTVALGLCDDVSVQRLARSMKGAQERARGGRCRTASSQSSEHNRQVPFALTLGIVVDWQQTHKEGVPFPPVAAEVPVDRSTRGKEACRLPRAPIESLECCKASSTNRFGRGAVVLNALTALSAGKLARIAEHPAPARLVRPVSRVLLSSRTARWQGGLRTSFISSS